MPEKPRFFDSSEEPTLVPQAEKTRVPAQKDLDTIMVRERNTIVPPPERVSEERVDEFAFTIRELLGHTTFFEHEPGADMSDFYLMLAYHIVKRNLEVFAHVQKPSDIEIQLPEKSPAFDMSAPMLYVITPNTRLEVTQKEIFAVQMASKK